MTQKFYKTVLLILLIWSVNATIVAQKNIENQISDSLTVIANSITWVGKVKVIELSINNKSNKIIVSVKDNFAYMPFRPESVRRIYKAIRSILPRKYVDFTITCQVENKNIEELIPNFYRTEKNDEKRCYTHPALAHPLVTNTSQPNEINKGLSNRHIALWQSHGWHYDQKLARWEWQRARDFQTVEDLYTQSYVLPFLVPMLENAGATVLLPRERDTQTNEVIVDNDTKNRESRYREHNDQQSWETGITAGFAHTQKFYLQGENPFTFGTYRVIKALTDANETSRVEWTPNIPEAGRYAVYISYKTIENSATDAHYTIFHKGGKTEFTVNQTMNGGTWLYLGHFYFDKGKNNLGKVMLTNLSSEEGKMITADAIKVGGGMGNIARNPNEGGSTPNLKSSDSLSLATELIKPSTIYEPETSGYPRYTEAGRYWLQWAGVPDSIYSKSQGKNDYTDDYQSRGNWVNYLTAGSTVAPNNKGLGVPVDLALAFHTDAGTTLNDSIIGTLGIFTVQNSDGKSSFANGISRWASRDLTDIVMTEIVNDIRTQYAPEWTRRGLWNKSYSESRVPEVPTMLLELLSHQNFADMRYGLDPRFRFTVSRSIYKGMLKYLSAAHQTDYIVQPLPVEQFSCRFTAKNKLKLQWTAVTDSLEATATAKKYILYTRIDDGAFDKGVIVDSTNITLNVTTGKLYSYKITAINEGGESFPSEILSAYRAPNEQGEVIVVNGFDRISAPSSFAIDSLSAGFTNDKDAGVPYLSDISFIGKQYEFDRKKPWVDDDAPGCGASNADFETTVIAGNSFDYPFLHGKAIKAAGFSFVSCSRKALEKGSIDLNEYKIADIILGKQKQTIIGKGQKAAEFKTFPLALQQVIRSYCAQGGNLLISGAHISSDLCEGERLMTDDRLFLENTLKIKHRTSRASVSGNVKVVNSPLSFFKKMSFSFFDQPNSISYFVESPDAIEPSSEGSFTICRYSENNLSAGVAFAGKYKSCAIGFPFETIQSESDRTKLMESILLFLADKKQTVKSE